MNPAGTRMPVSPVLRRILAAVGVCALLGIYLALTLGTAAVRAWRSSSKEKTGFSVKSIAWPWFILFFLGAAVLSTYVKTFAPVYPWLSKAGRVGLTVTLFLIGTGMSRASLKKVGIRPLVHGVVLWIVVATSSLLVIRSGWIGIQ
jgi:uncharacterized membrane protein YadS